MEWIVLAASAVGFGVFLWMVSKHPQQPPKNIGRQKIRTVYRADGSQVWIYHERMHGTDWYSYDILNTSGNFSARSPLLRTIPTFDVGRIDQGGTPPTDADKRKKAGLPPLTKADPPKIAPKEEEPPEAA